MLKFVNLLPWRRRRMERDLERELRHHLDSRTEELLRSGLTGAEARRRAALEFGGVARVREEVRETWTWRWLDALAVDLRYAGRTFSRNHIFAATAVLSLGLGIGASTAMFSLFDQILLRPLPVEEPDRLVQLAWRGEALAGTWGGGHLLSYAHCLDLEEQTQVFESVFCRSPATVDLSVGRQRERVRAELVSGSYFEALGATPSDGRLIAESDARVPGARAVVVLSHGYWRNRLGAAPIIGRTVLVRNYPMTVIGIAPPDFLGMDPLAPPALWIPATLAPEASPLEPGWDGVLDRRVAWMHVFARLDPDATAEDAESALRPWFAARLEAELRNERLQAASPEDRRAFRASTLDVLPAAGGVSAMRGLFERPLRMLMAGTALLLVLASLNVSGVLLARGVSRGGELSTRIALGASRRRLSGQLVVESTLLALGGGFLGVVVAPILSRFLLSVMTYDGGIPIGFDHRAFLFALIVSGLTAALCGLAPLTQTGELSLAELLGRHARGTARARVRLRKALVSGQMALTLLLLIGASLFVQTVRNLQAGAGFSAGSQVLFSLDPTSIGYSVPDSEHAMREVLRLVREIPGVENAALANTSLLTGGWSTRSLTIDARERIVSNRPVPFMRVSPGFFETLKTPILAGRDFDARDIRPAGRPPRAWQSAIVNESFARRYFDGRNPVGSRLGVGSDPTTRTDIQIVGVVSDFHRRSLRDEATAHVFFPYWDRDSDGGTFYVSAQGDPGSIAGAIRAAVEQVDPALPVPEPITLADQVERSIWTDRAVATLVTAFAVVALLLSVVGLYGVMSFVTMQRRREVGIRIALGSTRPATLWLMTRDALVMAGAGIGLAVPAAWALQRLVESQLFGVRAFDAPTVVLAAALLAIVSLGAAIRPAWRAASIRPAEALRLE